MSSTPIPIRPPCRGHDAWTEEDWNTLATAYASLERLYVLLAEEHRRATTRRMWWDFWSFALGALAMAIVIALLASTR
jgi:hypothetical protein